MRKVTKIILKLFFTAFIAFFPPQAETVIDQSFSVDCSPFMLKFMNTCFLKDFCGNDTLKIQKCWGAHNKGRTKILFVEKDSQRLIAINLIDTFKVSIRGNVSTGSFGHGTPTGEFKIIKKKNSRPSYRYGGTMTYWNCITDDEKFAIHGLKNKSYEASLGKPVSHGCIRVSTLTAKEIYDTVPIGTDVIIE
jgi:hypothetical protein